MRSLQLKIFALAALLVVLTQAGTVVTVLYTANRDVIERARSKLVSTAKVFELMLPQRPTLVQRSMQFLADDRKFGAAIWAGDYSSVINNLSASRSRVAADLALVLDEAGNVLAADGHPPDQAAVFPQLVQRTTDIGASREVADVDGATYEMITLPVRGLPEGKHRWLSMGLAMDDRRAASIREVSGLDVAFVSTTGGVTRLLGSSLTPDDKRSLAVTLPARHDSSPREIVKLEISGGDYLAIGAEVLPGRPDVQVLMMESLDNALAPYRLLRLSVILIGAIALAIAVLGAAVVARAMTKPVMQLAGAARRIREGDYSEPISIDASDELGELAEAFTTMQQGIAEREQRITYQAQFDALTGLPSRLLGLEQLAAAIERCRAKHRSVSVLVVDLGNFGDVSSSLGHEIGDAMLSQAAERMRARVDARNTVARLEGGEFLVVLEGVDREQAENHAEDLLRALSVGFTFNEVNVDLETVIGIAVYPQHSEVPEQLLLRAAVAKNDAQHGGQRIHVYQDGREERRVRQMSILGDLRRAVRHDELKLHVQPKIDLAVHQVCGAEALVRWDHPVLGWLPPNEFIPFAEQSGNITLITTWALSTAVRECRLWLEEGLRIPVSVNLSSRDLQDERLPVFVTELLRDHDLSPDFLTLEITEQALVRDFARATSVLQCLRNLGVRISIDDFGTGYSSLAQLRNLPVDELKIDRSFVLQLPESRPDAAIVRASVDLAHDLGLEVVAEGVENLACMRWLMELGCERAQGFLFSRPMATENFVAWVRQFSSAQFELSTVPVATPAKRQTGNG